MSRPYLRSVPLPSDLLAGVAIITMSVGQWDALLDAAYQNGWLLLELDDNEHPVAAYIKD